MLFRSWSDDLQEAGYQKAVELWPHYFDPEDVDVRERSSRAHYRVHTARCSCGWTGLRHGMHRTLAVKAGDDESLHRKVMEP